MNPFAATALLSLLAVSFGLGLIPSSASAQTVFMVQLGSFKSDQEAADHWNDLSKKFPDLFKPLTYSPAEVVLPPDDFVYHRTQAGPIATRDAAQQICDRLKGASEECFVVESAMFTAPSAAEEAATKEDAEPVKEKSLFARLLEPDDEDDKADAKAPEPADAASVETAADTTADDTAPAEPAPASRSEPEAAPSPMPETQMAPAASAPEPAPIAAPVTSVTSEPAAPFAMASSAATPQAPVTTMPSGGEENAVGNGANVRVAEAIPVPLSNPKTVVADSPYGSGFRGTPSSYNRYMPYWAEIGYFESQRGALGYWSTLRGRDGAIPGDLRLRITRPFQKGALANKVSLRVGPFGKVDAVRRLCALTQPEKLGCRAVRDMGGSVSYNARAASRAPTIRNAYQQRVARVNTQANAMPFGGPTPKSGGYGAMPTGGGNYWIQLGSFMARAAAYDRFEQLRGENPALLGNASASVTTPVSGRGIVRLRVGPYARSAEATATCNGLKRQGQLCVVVSQ